MGKYELLGYAIEALSTMAFGLLQSLKEEGEGAALETVGDLIDSSEDDLNANDEEIDEMYTLTGDPVAQFDYVMHPDWDQMTPLERVSDICAYYKIHGNIINSVPLIRPLGYTLEMVKGELLIVKIEGDSYGDV